jgi:hypothetical protein
MRTVTRQVNTPEKNSTRPLIPSVASAGMSDGARMTIRRVIP